MPTAEEIIQKFGAVEDDQRYTRLVKLFTDDAIYHDPFMGAQRGKDAWEVCAENTTAWARWTMYARGGAGEVAINGQSIYRLRDDGDGLKVCFVADYLDSNAYGLIKKFWHMQDTG